MNFSKPYLLNKINKMEHNKKCDKKPWQADEDTRLMALISEFGVISKW